MDIELEGVKEGVKFSQRTLSIKRSPIRELLKLIVQPEIISFAGGIPDPSLFPTYLIQEAVKEILQKYPEFVLQYGPTEGYPPLTTALIDWIKENEGITVEEDEVLVTTASQQGLDLISKVFLDKNDIVVLGLPSYLGGITAFRMCGVKFIGVPLDDEGMQIEELKKILKKLHLKEIKRIKFIYIVPDFQNPAGVSLSLERRYELIELAEYYDLLIIEDSPYRKLRYEGENIPSIFSLSPERRTILLYTFSKLFCPGMRLGFIVGDREYVDKLTIVKQATDLCTSPFTQGILCEMIKGGALETHIKKLVSVYQEKRKYMLKTLDKYMNQLEGVSWTRPYGGLFLWMRLPYYMDTEKMLKKALKKKVAYVAGVVFHFDGSGKNTLRLNFSYPSIKEIDEGIKRLSEVISEEIR